MGAVSIALIISGIGALLLFSFVIILLKSTSLGALKIFMIQLLPKACLVFLPMIYVFLQEKESLNINLVFMLFAVQLVYSVVTYTILYKNRA